MHCETTMSFHNEIKHAQVKLHLKTSTDDLKTMINNINLMLKNQIHNHLSAWDENKIRFSTECRKLIFQQLTAFVNSYVIKQIMSQYQFLTKRSIVLSSCVDIFIIIMSLFCSHKIQKRLYTKESLLIENVYVLCHSYSFWHSLKWTHVRATVDYMKEKILRRIKTSSLYKRFIRHVVDIKSFWRRSRAVFCRLLNHQYQEHTAIRKQSRRYLKTIVLFRRTRIVW